MNYPKHLYLHAVTARMSQEFAVPLLYGAEPDERVELEFFYEDTNRAMKQWQAWWRGRVDSMSPDELAALVREFIAHLSNVYSAPPSWPLAPALEEVWGAVWNVLREEARIKKCDWVSEVGSYLPRFTDWVQYRLLQKWADTLLSE